MNGIRIERDRIALREWDSRDQDAIYRLMGDPEVVRYLSWKPLTRVQCGERLDGFIFDQHCCAKKKPLGWLGDFVAARTLSRILQRRTVNFSAAPPAACLGEPDCRRYRYYFAVELLPSKRVIGEAGFEWASKDRASREAEVGYFLEREFWGHGYATEAALLAMDFAFSACGAEEVSAACDPRNSASARVMQRCGLIPNRLARPDEPIRMSLSKSAWQSGHNRAAAR